MLLKNQFNGNAKNYQTISFDDRQSFIGMHSTQSDRCDLGMSANEMLQAGLAMCKVAMIKHVAENKGWNLGNIKVNMSQANEKSELMPLPKKAMQLTIEGNIEEAQMEELFYEADHSYIHSMLESYWNITRNKSNRSLGIAHSNL